MPAAGQPADLAGSGGRPSSPSTMTSGPAITVGPPRCGSPGDTNEIPAKPVSVEPMASVITASGSALAQASLTAGENSAALEDTATSEEAS